MRLIISVIGAIIGGVLLLGAVILILIVMFGGER